MTFWGFLKKKERKKEKSSIREAALKDGKKKKTKKSLSTVGQRVSLDLQSRSMEMNPTSELHNLWLYYMFPIWGS